MVSARVMPTSLRAGCVLIAVLVSCALQACENSILRNAGEAGLETILEGPLPTPTVTVRARAAATPPR